MAGKRKKLLRRKKIPIYLALIGIVMMGLLAVKWGMTSEAENNGNSNQSSNQENSSGYSFVIDGIDCGTSCTLYKSEVSIQLKKAGTDELITDNITWSWSDSLDSYLKVKPNNDGVPMIYIDKIPNSIQEPKLYAMNGTKLLAELKVKFALRIDDSVSHYFRTALKEDERDSLFLTTSNIDNDTGEIGQNNIVELKTFLDVDGGCTWECGKENVIEPITDENGQKEPGAFRAVQAGMTTIKVTAEGNKSSTDTINVYVLPKIVRAGENIDKCKTNTKEETASEIGIRSGDKLNINVNLDGANMEEKVYWSIYKGTTFIADSNTNSDTISLIQKKDQIYVTAKAGKYILRVYPIPANDKEKNYQNWNDEVHDQAYPVSPTTIKLTVYPEFTEKSISMNVGDQFDIADALNVLPEDIEVKEKGLYQGVDGSGTSISNVNIDDYISIDKNKVTAKKETPDNQYIQVEIEPKDGIVFENTGGNSVDSIKLYLRITDPVLLNVTDVTLNKGETMDLSLALSNNSTIPYDWEKCEWSSNNTECVEVDQKTGVITGRNYGDAEITVQLKMPSGITKVSKCKVHVRETITKISLDYSELELIAGGDAKMLSASFIPANTENEKIHWLCSDETIVEMEQPNGSTKMVSLKGLKPGSAVITVLNEENMVTAICKVTVVQKVSSITISETEKSVNIKQGFVRFERGKDVVINPTDANDTSLVWNSTNPSVIAVDKDVDGLFKLVGPGTATISVYYKNDPTVSALCKITVTAGSESITIDKTASVEVGEKITLNSIITPTTAVTNVRWYSSDEKIATVDELTGEITGVSVGTTHIMAVTDEGHTDKCELTVTQRASGIAFPQEEITVAKGSTLALEYELTPKDATVTPSWRSFNENIVSVNEDGVITANEVGETYVTVTIPDGFTASIRIKVTDKSTGIQLTQEEYNVTVGTTALIGYTLIPANATTTLTWKSLDESIATVADGVITGVKTGSTYIVVTSADGYSVTCKVHVSQFATGITLESDQYVIEMGNTQKIGYTFTPEDGTAVLIWKCLDETVATVDDQGVVTAVGVGNTFVVVTSSLGYSATCSIVVTQQPSSITLAKTEVIVNVGETYAIEYSLVPANSTAQTVTWTTQNAGVATVDESGKVTGVAKGTTFIIGSLPNGYVTYLNVVVKEAVKGVTLETTEKTIVKGETFTLKPVFTPAEPSNTNMTWTSSNEKAAKVNAAGKVTGVAGGVANITGTTEDGGYTVMCTVTVKEKVTKISLNHSSYRLVKGKTVKLKATVTSNTATTKKVKWTTSKKAIATVTSTGLVKGKKVGTCVIKATTTDGTKKTAKCTIRVIQRVSSLQINKTYAKVMQGKTLTLKTKITPSKASIKHLKWSSSDETIATVTSRGKVTGITPGTCTITAKTTDGSNLKVTCNLVVYEEVPATDISIIASDITMVVGKTQSAGVTINPANTTDKIRYASDRPSVATVSSKGKIKGIRPGTATITVSTSSGLEKFIGVTVVGLNKTSMTLEQYDSDELWVEGIDANVKWSSSNPAVARVEDGKVIARKVGSCTITASVDGVKLNCSVKVTSIR